MAKTDEIAQISLINKELETLNGTLNKTAKSYLDLVKSIEEGTKIAKGFAVSQEGLTRAQKEANQAAEKADALDKQLAAQTKKLTELEDSRIKTIVETKLKIQEQTKAISDKVKAEQAEEGSLIRMRARLKELTTEYDKAGIRTKAATEEINKLSREIGKAEEATNRGQRSVGQYGKMWEGLKGMLPVLGIATAAAAIGGALTAIKNSTQATADAFQFAVKGMSTGLDFFWKTLATGNWSNFFDNLGKAISGGYAYAKMLDEVADNNRALRIIESNARGEELRLEEALKNKTLSTADRLKAGQDRIALEEKLSRDRQKIADKNFEAELSETMRQTGLSRDRLLAISKDFDSEKLLMANQYNEALKFQESRRINKTSEEYAKFIPILKNTTDATKEYAATIRGYDIATEEQQNKFVTAIVQRNEAINSAPENLKKVITRVNGLIAESSAVEQKKNADSVEGAKKAADKKIKEEERLAYSKTGLAKMTQKEQEVIEADGLKSNQKYLNEKLKQAEKEASDERKIQEGLKKAKVDLAIQAGNAIFEFSNMAFQKELNQLQVEKDTKLNNSKLTTEQRAKIEAEYTKKQNEIKAKEAKNSKLQAMFNIAINTIQGVSAASAMPPLFAANPMIPWLIAMGILQSGLVAAQPIPKYAKGTQSAAEAGIFGEAGRELMVTRLGETILTDKATFFEGSKFKGAKIYSNTETERMVKGAGLRTMTDERILAGLVSLNESTNRVEKAIKNKPVAIYDKDHRQIGLGNDKHQKIYLNRLINRNQ